jgi:Zn-dependent protease
MCRCRAGIAIWGMSLAAADDLGSPAALAGYIVAILLSLAFHESAHALVAHRLGDDTARTLGRVTLNPVPHIDPVGTIVLPILLYVTHSPYGLAWAKPVPVNPFRLRNPVLGMATVAAAGPVSNLILAFFFAGLVGLAGRAGDLAGNAGYQMLETFVWLNVSLAVFNLLPVPPLDGSSVVATLLPERVRTPYLDLGWGGLFVILILQHTGILRAVLGPPREALLQATDFVARSFGG